MEYISAEEFSKQSKEVKKVFLDWWQPNKGDLFENSLIGGFGVLTVNKNYKDGLTPLLAEGQLRQFIEDKTESKIIGIIYYEDNGYDIKLQFDKLYENLGTDLLEAYWKVALEIAKDHIMQCSKCINCEIQGIYAGGEKMLFCHQANRRANENNVKECKCYEEYEE